MFQTRILFIKTDCCAILRVNMTEFQLKKRREYPHQIPRAGTGGYPSRGVPVGDANTTMAGEWQMCSALSRSGRSGTLGRRIRHTC